LRFSRIFFAVLLAAALPLFIARPAHATTYTWSAFGAGDWFLATNWTPNGVPGPGDTAIINNYGRPTANSAVNVAEIDLSSGFLDGTAPITVTKAFNITEGSVYGSGKIEIPAGAVLQLLGYARFSQRTIDIMGSANWTSGDNIDLGEGAVLNNRGTFEVQDGKEDIEMGSDGSDSFNNTGTLISSAGASTVFIETYFNNQGSTIVKSGTLKFTGDGMESGTFQADGGNFGFSGGDFTLQTASSISGTGNVTFSSAAVVDSGSYSITGSTTIAGGSVIFAQPFVNATALDVKGTVTFFGGYTQTTGSATLDAGTLTSTNGFNIAGGLVTGSGRLNGAVINNGAIDPGTAIQLGDITISGNLTEIANGVINIRVGPLATGRSRQTAAASDMVNVGGTAHLGGTLNVMPPSGTPAISMVEVVSYFSQDGAFARILGVASPDRLVVGPQNVTLTSEPTGSLAAGVSMVSVPYFFPATGQTAADLFQVSPLPDGTMPVATWDPTKLAYEDYPQLPGAQTQPGRGYWIELAAAKTFTAVGVPVSSPFVQALSPGWNMIGDPFPTAVAISTLQFTAGTAVGSNPANTPLTFSAASAAGLVDSTVYGYSGTGYVAATALQPYSGYWIYVDPTTAGNQSVQLTFTQ